MALVMGCATATVLTERLPDDGMPKRSSNVARSGEKRSSNEAVDPVVAGPSASRLARRTRRAGGASASSAGLP